MWSMLRANRDLRWLFFAQVISYLGDWFAYVAFVGLVQEYSDRTILVSLVLVCNTLPAFLMSPLAGAVADRFDRKRIIVVVSLAQAVSALGMLLVGRNTLWLGYVCLVIIGGLAAFIGPAAQAAVPNLARDQDELRAAGSLFGSLWGAMLAIGAGLGGLFTDAFGRTASFVADSASFVGAAVFVLMIGRAMQEHTSALGGADRRRVRPLDDMRQAIAYARSDSAVLAFLGSKVAFAIGCAGLVGLLAAFATDELDGADRATGFLIAARGLGAAIGPMVALKLAGGRLDRLLLVCGVAGITVGSLYALVGTVHALWLAMVLVCAAHLLGGSQWSLSTYGLQVLVPDHVRGRVLAGDFAMATLFIGMSGTIAGWSADAIGIRPTFWVFGGIAIMTGVVYLVLTGPVRARLQATRASDVVSLPAG